MAAILNLKAIVVVTSYQLVGQSEQNAGRRHFIITSGMIACNPIQLADGLQKFSGPFRFILAVIQILCKWILIGGMDGFPM